MTTKDTLTIEVLMGIGSREGQWLTQADDRDEETWHPSRAQAMAQASQYASDHNGPVVIHADQPWAQEAPKTEISDAASIIAFACSMVAEDNFTHSPRIVARADFDLTQFKAQPSSVPGVDAEYVCQGGGGMTGDDFHGTIAWPVDAERLFVLEY